MSDNPDFYFENKKVKNFEILHYHCREDPLTKTEKKHKTVCRNYFENYPKDKLGPCFKNLSRIFQIFHFIFQQQRFNYFLNKFL